MLDLLGITGISFVFLITLYFSLLYKEIFKILIIAYLVRILFLIINNNFFYLPDGDMDGLIFEQRGWNWSQDGFINLFKYYNGPGTYFYSLLIAIPYSILGRSFLFIQSFSILFGIGSVLIGYLIGKKLWGNNIAIKATWIIALFPSIVSYSVLAMREVYITFFILLAINGIIEWSRNKTFKSIIIITLSFIAATFFHGASAIGLLVFLLIISLENLKKILKLILNQKINLKILVVTICSSVVILAYVFNKFDIPYMDNFKTASDPDHLKFVINDKIKGDAAYPEWTRINSNSELIYKIPIRAIYFLISPLPWEIYKTSHLLGMVDSILYMFLIFLIFRNRKVIWKDPGLRIILLILVSYFIVFGVGVGNFGSGIRHRTKFVIGLILLAAPLIPRLIIFKKNWLKKIK